MKQDGDIEAAEMEDFLSGRVFEHRNQIRRLFLSRRDLNDIGGAVARRKLHQTKPVAPRDKTKGFRINGNRATVAFGIRSRDITLVKPYCIGHGNPHITTRCMRYTACRC